MYGDVGGWLEEESALAGYIGEEELGVVQLLALLHHCRGELFHLIALHPFFLSLTLH
jgi:hypothetical protein